MKQTELVSGSPETQQLLDLCLAIARGERNYLTVLREKVNFRHTEMQRAVDDFFGQVERQGEEWMARYKAELDEVSERFKLYEAALQSIAACIDAGAAPEHLREHATALAEASHFLRVAIGRYEQAELATGPSKFPLVNILDNLGKHRGTDVWNATCGQYLELYKRMLEEIQKSDRRQAPGVPEREKAVAFIVELFGQLGRLGPGDPDEKLSALLSDLTAAHLNLESAFNVYNEAVLTAEPTRSPQVNLVLNTVAGFQAGQFTVQALRQAVEGYLEIVRNGMAELRATLSSQSDSALLSESAATLLEAMEGVEDALQVLLELADNPALEPQRVQDALQRLRESGDRGAEATAVVREFNESVGMVACIHCSTMNPPEVRVCSKCARPMPLAKFGSSGQATMEIREGGMARGGGAPDFTQETVMTDTIKALFDMCEAYEKGEIEAQTLISLLDSRQSEIEQAAQKLSAFKAPDIPSEASDEEREVSEQFVQLTNDALDMLDAGLAQCQDGLDKIRHGLETGNLDLMDQGRELYYEGCQKMWEIWRLDNAMDGYLGEDDGEENSPDVE